MNGLRISAHRPGKGARAARPHVRSSDRFQPCKAAARPARHSINPTCAESKARVGHPRAGAARQGWVRSADLARDRRGHANKRHCGPDRPRDRRQSAQFCSEPVPGLFAIRRAITVAQHERQACIARPARLSARSGCFRPIFDPDPADFRAELVRTTLGAALRRRPGAAPRARALCPFRDCLLTPPYLSHLFTPSNTPTERPLASRLVLATEFGGRRGRRNIMDQFHPNWKPIDGPLGRSRVTNTSDDSRTTPSACSGKPPARG